jgi:hypothetical protein
MIELIYTEWAFDYPTLYEDRQLIWSIKNENKEYIELCRSTMLEF